MRAVGLSDLDVAARALLASPRADWPDVARRLIEEAHSADLWRKHYGVGHPKGGTGSLYAQACLHKPVASSRCTAGYLAALKVVVSAIEDWRSRHHKNL